MQKKYIAYQGIEFILEWYYDDRGKSDVLEYFNNLTKDRKKKILNLLSILGDHGKLFNEEKFRYENDQIYAIKAAPDRFLCFFFKGSKIIITNAFEKKSKKLPIKEKTKALKAKDDYTKRCERSDYYD